MVLIDALNQFEPTTRARHLTWLPRSWPQNARLIATAIPGSQSEVLEKRQRAILCALPDLSEAEATEIARAVCARYHRTIGADVLNELLGRRLEDGVLATGNPLWLELAVEALNLLDADDFARMDLHGSGTPATTTPDRDDRGDAGGGCRPVRLDAGTGRELAWGRLGAGIRVYDRGKPRGLAGT